MGKLIVLMGKSGSGKSTIEKILERNYCYKRVISTTTRPPRSGEIPFVDYYFIPEEVFEIYNNRGEFLETSRYPTNGIMYSYGVHKKDINIEEEDNILIVERHGYEQLIKTLGRENIISILVEADKDIRADRYRQRDTNYKEEDIITRGERDDRLFAGLEDEVDIVVKNNGDINETINIILNEIRLLKNEEVLAECFVSEAEEFMCLDDEDFMFDFSDCTSVTIRDDKDYRTTVFVNYIHIPNLQIDIHEGFGEYFDKTSNRFEVDYSFYALKDSITGKWLYTENSSIVVTLMNFFRDSKVADYKAKFIKTKKENLKKWE